MFKVCYRDFNVNEVVEIEKEEDALRFAENLYLRGYLIVQVYNQNNEIFVEFEN